MAQFDVYDAGDGSLLIDCQSDSLGYLATRLSAPLIPLERAPDRRLRLNPIFDVNDETYVLVTQFAAAVRCADLRNRVATLAAHRDTIIAAFDMLLTGV
ncbi:CcdB family protein [Sphingomonas sp. RHCKR47]|uniref:CcdB family protein n=1 Tax=Sphingomonas citricola TaxID=2862498 RepID=UPI001C682DF0|nr:CcdB family protein [Sphingomonas citricola]MBW6524047.1 CcdB family protein [Sphingomonas citricola]